MTIYVLTETVVDYNEYCVAVFVRMPPSATYMADGDVAFFLDMFPLNSFRAVAEAKNQFVVCETSLEQWHSAGTDPLNLWEWLNPRDLFKYSREKTDISISIYDRKDCFVRGAALDAMPIRAIDLCLSEWAKMPKINEPYDEYERQFIPHIEAYVAERHARLEDNAK